MLSEDTQVLKGLSYSLLVEWVSILTLIFGGCCSNALTLEQLTHGHPHSGRLITFCQFFAISLHGLPKFITFKPYPWLKPRQIPLLPYIAQVLLFLGINLLNNAAFAYSIPMPVHIIFRSGGLVFNMIFNWLFAGKKYNNTQVLSIGLVTAGVGLTTLSAAGSNSRSPSSTAHAESHPLTYATGIALLTLALVLSAFLGLVQDKAYSRYKRQPSASGLRASEIPPWQESMFYLHFLSLPMFIPMRQELVTQTRAMAAGPKLEVRLPSSLAPLDLEPLSALVRRWQLPAGLRPETFAIPLGFLHLFLNTTTQLFCVAGVNRLTTRVSSLTVTLVLVVRKAISLIISVVLFSASGRASAQVNVLEMWTGAFLVFAGTVGYTFGSGRKDAKDKPKEE